MNFFKEVLRQNPNKSFDNDKVVQTVAALSDCTASCNACADACLQEESVKELARCIRMLMSCKSVCQATADVISRPGGSDMNFLESQLQGCVSMCKSCADECRQHAQKHEHCRACADACQSCMETCQDLMQSISTVSVAI